MTPAGGGALAGRAGGGHLWRGRGPGDVSTEAEDEAVRGRAAVVVEVVVVADDDDVDRLDGGGAAEDEAVSGDAAALDGFFCGFLTPIWVVSKLPTCDGVG